MNFLLPLISFASAVLCQITFQPKGHPFKSPVTVGPNLKASVAFSNLTVPRGIAIDGRSNVLVVERGVGVTAFWSASAGWYRKVVVTNPGLTHGIVLDSNKLYVSTATDVYRYNYNPQTRSVIGSHTVVVNNLPGDGELKTHPLLIESSDSTKRLIVSTGPFTNVDLTARDASSGRSQIRRFSLSSTAPQSWLSGTLLGYGIRYPAAFALSDLTPGTTIRNMWTLENGASIDELPEMTPAFANDNPADELNVVDVNAVDDLGRFYGFPDCTSIWNGDADPVAFPQFVGQEPGYQFSLGLEPTRDDAWCDDGDANNAPPVYVFPAHSVPLDIKFYPGPTSHSAPRALPTTWVKDAFVSFHGSFNRSPPTGYGIVRMPFRNGTPHVPEFEPLEFIIQVANLAGCPTNCLRPVGVAFGSDGRLFATSDETGELFVIEAATPSAA